MIRAIRATLVILALCGLTACDRGPAPLHIGYKPFTEQEILSVALERLLRDAGHPVAGRVPCADTWACQARLRAGDIDLMVDYTGTALNFVGAPPGPASLARIQALYAPLGQRWLAPLGFDNGYRVLVGPRDVARDLQDLAARGPLRIACPAEYTRRPRDGLAALAGRYGLRLAPRPLILDDPAERARAVLEGRADLAVGYGTDAWSDDLGLRALEDPLGFFPEYAAALTLRVAAAEAHPGLPDTLERLTGRLDPAAMRALNGQVQIIGERPETVAGRWLLAQGLISPEGAVDRRRPGVVIAVPPAEDLEAAARRARRAVRTVFPERSVRHRAEADPVAAIRDGRAWLAVMGAERFYRHRLRDRLAGRADLQLEPGVEAVAVLGERALHIVRRRADPGQALAGRLGAPPDKTGDAALVDRALQARGLTVTRRGDPQALIEALRAGQLDAALLVAEPGARRLTAPFAAGDLSLRPWPEAQAAPVRLPFARILRLPPDTYPGQTEAVDTLSAQLLLVGPAQGPARAEGGGPAGALAGRGAPLSAQQVRALAEAIGVAEAPDPGLPSAWRRGRIAPATLPLGGRILDALLNLLILLFTALVVRLALGATPAPAGTGSPSDDGA